MKTKDNWGWKARIGMFIVSSEPVPEAEWWAMLSIGRCARNALRKPTVS